MPCKPGVAGSIPGFSLKQLSVEPSGVPVINKACIAICFRKTAVYRNGLYIRDGNLRNKVSVSLCLVPF